MRIFDLDHWDKWGIGFKIWPRTRKMWYFGIVRSQGSDRMWGYDQVWYDGVIHFLCFYYLHFCWNAEWPGYMESYHNVRK